MDSDFDAEAALAFKNYKSHVHKREFVLAKTRLCHPQIKILSEYTSLWPGCLASSEESGWSLFW